MLGAVPFCKAAAIACCCFHLAGAPHPGLLRLGKSAFLFADVWFTHLFQTSNLARYSSYRERDAIPTANLMLSCILKPARHQSFYKTYASRKFLKVGISSTHCVLSLTSFPCRLASSCAAG